MQSLISMEKTAKLPVMGIRNKTGPDWILVDVVKNVQVFL